MKVFITIRPDHLKHQKAADCYRCAVALAISEVLNKKAAAVHVGDYQFRIENAHGSDPRRQILPAPIPRFIKLADRSDNRPDYKEAAALMLPLAFETDIPAEYVRTEVLS